jgi:DNA-binding HxlR family transcriptional regulator
VLLPGAECVHRRAQRPLECGVLGDRGVLRSPPLRAAGAQPQHPAPNLNIPRPTLSARLRTLVDAGLLERVPSAEDLDRPEYRLTDAGRDLFPAIVALMRWSDTHLAGPGGPPIVLRHHACGQIADPRLTCQHCGQEIDARNVTPEAGPRLPSRQPAEEPR